MIIHHLISMSVENLLTLRTPSSRPQEILPAKAKNRSKNKAIPKETWEPSRHESGNAFTFPNLLQSSSKILHTCGRQQTQTLENESLSKTSLLKKISARCDLQNSLGQSLAFGFPGFRGCWSAKRVATSTTLFAYAGLISPTCWSPTWSPLVALPIAALSDYVQLWSPVPIPRVPTKCLHLRSPSCCPTLTSQD